MIIVITCRAAVAVIAFILGVRPKDLPAAGAGIPFAHLDERKAAIYENLRDLQFEYRVGKLSDDDYQNTKKDLQRNWPRVLAEVDRVRGGLASAARRPPPSAPPSGTRLKPKPTGLRMSHPAARNSRSSLKFCGECGKPMKAASMHDEA